MTKKLGLWTAVGIGIATAVWVATDKESGAENSSQDLAQSCTEDGYMLVMGGVEDLASIPDPERAAQYGPAVWSLVESYGAFYLVRKEPDVVYEGDWPAWKLVVISKWPCRETGNAFWYSDAYQNDVKPLRKDAGVYDVGMFDAAPDFPPAGVEDLVPDTCADPFLVVALTKPTNLEAYGAYNKVLSETRLGFRAGLNFLFTGRPVDVLEGAWPDGYNALVSTYPCRAAWEAFYYGETYQTEIKPMRDGAGDVIILGFDPERVR